MELVRNLLSGAIPHVVGHWTHIGEVYMSSNRLKGWIPDSLAFLMKAHLLTLSSNSLSGWIPDAVASWQQMIVLNLRNNALSGPIPNAIVLCMQATVVSLQVNALSGSIPDAVASLAQLMGQTLDWQKNKLSGTIPRAVGFLTQLQVLFLSGNALSGSIPDALSSVASMMQLEVADNMLSGSIPNSVAALAQLQYSLYLNGNALSGAVPTAMGFLAEVQRLKLDHNTLSGSVPDCVASMGEIRSLYLHMNGLYGTIPASLSFLTWFQLYLSDNKFSGPIPDVSLPEGFFRVTFAAERNQLSGSIGPAVAAKLPQNFLASDNQLEGTCPSFIMGVHALALARNVLEGTVPQRTGHDGLTILDISNEAGKAGGLTGPLPPYLGRARRLDHLSFAHQDLRGVIPPMASSLLGMLALQNNQLRVFSGAHFFRDTEAGSVSVVLLFNNLLSCEMPRCDEERVGLSLCLLGNQVRKSKKKIWPAWIQPMERDRLFLASSSEGRDLLVHITVASTFMALVIAAQLGRHRLVRSLVTWHAGLGTHLRCLDLRDSNHDQRDSNRNPRDSNRNPRDSNCNLRDSHHNLRDSNR